MDASASSFILGESDSGVNRRTIVIDDFSSSPSCFFERTKSAGDWSRNESKLVLDYSSLESETDKEMPLIGEKADKDGSPVISIEQIDCVEPSQEPLVIEEPIIKVPLFTMPPAMVIDAEKHYKIDFSDHLSLKRLVNSKISEVGKSNLVLKKITDHCKIWTNGDGLSFCPDAGIVASEAYFPDLETPLELLHMLMNRREHFDMGALDIMEEVAEHRGHCLRLFRTVSKKSLVDGREVLEKKAYFQLSQVLHGLSEEERAAELQGGSEDDIYVWVASVPHDFIPKSKNGLRIYRHYGYHKIGYCRDLPESRRQEKGVYVHDMWATDAQLNWLVKSAAGPFVVDARAQNCADMVEYSRLNRERIRSEVAGKNIS